MADNKAPHVAAAAPTQAQMGSAEKEAKKRGAPENNEDEIQFFDTMIVKLVEKENEDGETEWVEVLSDNLYPGEKLKRAVDEEKQAEKEKKAREERAKANEDNNQK
jgi:hypothetical protein